MEGTHGRRYAGAFVGIARHAGRRTRSLASQATGQGRAENHWKISGVGVCRSGLHRRKASRGCGPVRHQAGGCETAGSQAWFCAAAATLGCGTIVRLAGTVSSAEQGLRAAARNLEDDALPRLRLHPAQMPVHRNPRKCITRSKLRMSRKLIFASGLMMCFSCYLQPPPPVVDLFQVPNVFEPIVLHLRSFVNRTPLDIMADAFSAYTDAATAVKFFDAYSRFIEIVGDGTKRKHLEDLPAEQARTDATFADIRNVAKAFSECAEHAFL